MGIFGTHSDRELKRIKSQVDKVFMYEEEFSNLTDSELEGKTQEFKNRLEAGETLDMLLPEAFATVREASWRVLGMKPYRGPGYRRYHSSSGQNSRNEDR
jgi:preprotein translocase subunit SecA